MSEIKIVYMCSCGGDGIALSSDEDEELEIYVSMFSRGQSEASAGSGWKYRLEQIWQIIRKGHPYLDEVILDRNAARELAKELFKLADDHATSNTIQGKGEQE